MMFNNFASQSTEARNSAISNMFSKKSVLDFAVYAYNKMAKSSNGNSDKISVVVGDGYRVTMNCGMDENECRLVLNIYLEEKNGNRYVQMREYHSGWADMATEYMACGSWKSVVVYAIKDAIESMVSKVLDNYIKDGDKWSIAEWEKLSGMVYMAPSLEEAPMLEDDITDEGYSIMGLNYLSDTMYNFDVGEVVKETFNDIYYDVYIWGCELFRSNNACPIDTFMDTMWAYAWDNIRDRGFSDEALEAETRYYLNFDSVVKMHFVEWGLYVVYDEVRCENVAVA